MRQWLDLMRRVLETGERREDRTGTGTYSLFGESVSFDLSEGFPAVTTKRLAFQQVAAELSCFVHGSRHLSDFHQVGCKIWDANGSAPYWRPAVEGDLGRIYGVQWRDWRAIGEDGQARSTDQLSALLRGLRQDTWSRRHVVLAYQPGELDQVCLPACHVLFQASVRADQRLDLAVYMRSVDLFLGLPFDVASYALLSALLTKDTGLTPGRLTFFLGDVHVYLDHVEAARLVLSRAPMRLPTLQLTEEATTLDFHPRQARLLNYASHDAVPARMAV